MRSDIIPGATFPDYALPDQTGTVRTLSELQGRDPLILTLARGNYDAGYGRSGGGQVVVATKSGTSTFHGDAYEFVRNTALDSNEWFNKRTQAENNEPNKNPIKGP